MSLHIWTKAGAILITKTTRIVLPAIFLAIGAAIGAGVSHLIGTKKKKIDQNPRPE
jgi:hypothetical protein